MPSHGWQTAGGRAIRPAAAVGVLGVITLLSGCMGSDGPGVSMFGGAKPSDPAATEGQMALAAQDQSDRGESRSALIDDLIARRSVIPANSSYAKVADAILTANTGPAAAELRVARLKAEAKSKNWLPSIGPSVNLTSLGALAASILVEQVLFDNGKRKAERDYAAADVELAAVSLASEMNNRVYQGLGYYVTALKARDQAALGDSAVTRMNEYGRIMRLRVEGGLSDQSEARVINQKMAETEAEARADRDAAAAALSELNAIAARDLSGLSGLATLADLPKGPESLSVLAATGEGRQLVAEAKAQRAGLLPGLKASASLGKGGLDGGVSIAADQGFGFGTGASLKALEATGAVAEQRVANARDTSYRNIVALERQIITLTSRETELAAVLRQTEGALGLFTEQYKVGRRPLMELVGMFESYSRQERDLAALKFDVALLRLKIAQERGVLVDGSRM